MEQLDAEAAVPASPRQRNYGADLMRFLSISGVVVIHRFDLRMAPNPKGKASWCTSTNLDIGFN